MATFKVIERQPKGNVTKCQWCGRDMPEEYDIYLIQSDNSGTCYLACIDCVGDMKCDGAITANS